MAAALSDISSIYDRSVIEALSIRSHGTWSVPDRAVVFPFGHTVALTPMRQPPIDRLSAGRRRSAPLLYTSFSVGVRACYYVARFPMFLLAAAPLPVWRTRGHLRGGGASRCVLRGAAAFVSLCRKQVRL